MTQGQFYNDLHVSQVIDLDGDGKNGKSSAFDERARNGIHGTYLHASFIGILVERNTLPLALQGKIAGRGVLLDFFSYAQQNGISYAPNAYHTVTAGDLDKCARSQGVKFEQGDILFVRMGFIHWYEHLATEDEKMALAQPPTKAVGIRQAMEEVEWMWYVPSSYETCCQYKTELMSRGRDHHFAAVASDTPAFEARPNKLAEWNLHDYFLALWGVSWDLSYFYGKPTYISLKTPIGELFDLEQLSRICKELNRYSFFVTSSPLNIVNGIASPPK